MNGTMNTASPTELAAQVAELTEALQEVRSSHELTEHKLSLSQSSIAAYRAIIAALNDNLTVAKRTEDALRAEIAALRGATQR